MRIADVHELLNLLEGVEATVWLNGGWGIDALLGRQTRAHKDLDVFVRLQDLAAARRALFDRGFTLKEIWSENQWLPGDDPDPQAERATAFVLKDDLGREIDVHVLDVDEHGNATPLWDTEWSFGEGALAAQGSVGGRKVSCISAEMQIESHKGYALPATHEQDLNLLLDHCHGAPSDDA